MAAHCNRCQRGWPPFDPPRALDLANADPELLSPPPRDFVEVVSIHVESLRCVSEPSFAHHLGYHLDRGHHPVNLPSPTLPAFEPGLEERPVGGAEGGGEFGDTWTRVDPNLDILIAP
jgi:hypothetical protein